MKKIIIILLMFPVIGFTQTDCGEQPKKPKRPFSISIDDWKNHKDFKSYKKKYEEWKECLNNNGTPKKLIVVGADLKSNFFDFEPNIGVFISQNVLMGTGLSFSSTYSLSQSNNQIIISPYVRFYDKDVFYSIDCTYFISKLYTEMDTYVNLKNLTIGSNIGYSKEISSHFYLDPSIRISYASNFDNNGIDGYISERPNTFQVQFVLGVHFRL